MLQPSLIELIYESAHMQRWNDHIRPKGFTELDKQAQKMVITFLLGKLEQEESGEPLDWRCLLEGGIFEFLHRIVLTDIKPPVFHELMATHGEQLNAWVLTELAEQVKPVGQGFYEKMQRYFQDPAYSSKEKRILKAAHQLATHWEFQIVHHLNSHIYGVEETRNQIEMELERHNGLASVRSLRLNRNLQQFVDLVGQLRFQLRWAQSPRVPETSVLGHMLIVAMLAYLAEVQLGACDVRLCNTFFAALFHDLPEVLTRDIVSPVKRSVQGLEAVIKQIEDRQMAERVYPLLPPAWHAELRYFLEDEFASKVMLDGVCRVVSTTAIGESYNQDSYRPVDGEVIRVCDHLAAYIEAVLSMTHGITSRHLCEGATALYKRYHDRQLAGIDFGAIFRAFQREVPDCRKGFSQ